MLLFVLNKAAIIGFEPIQNKKCSKYKKKTRRSAISFDSKTTGFESNSRYMHDTRAAAEKVSALQL